MSLTTASRGRDTDIDIGYRMTSLQKIVLRDIDLLFFKFETLMSLKLLECAQNA